MRPIVSLKRRFAALLYESLLIGSVTILAGIVAGIINTIISRSTPALAPIVPLLTSIVFLLAWWQYSGQSPQQKTIAAALCLGVRAAGVYPLAGIRRLAAFGLAWQKRHHRRAVLVDIAVGVCPV